MIENISLQFLDIVTHQMWDNKYYFYIFWSLFTIGTIYALYNFIISEIELIKRNSEYEYIFIDYFKKDYNFFDFIGYNLTLLFGGIILFILFPTFTVGITLILIIGAILSFLVLLKYTINIVHYWLIIPVIFIIIKFVLYKISLKYKKEIKKKGGKKKGGKKK